MRGALVLGSVLATLAACAPRPPAANPGDVLQQILPSTVQLRAEAAGGARRMGSGVVVAADAGRARSWIVTTRHIMRGSGEQQVSVAVPGRRGRVKGQVVALNETSDLALVMIAGLALPPVTLKDTVRLGDEVRVVGFPWGRRLTVVSGIVSQIAGADGETATTGAARMIDASVSYGASGGGVFDAPTGALVGIVEGYRTARITLQTVPEKTVDVPVPGETTVIPAATIRSFLVGAGLSPP
ncbi:MAG TPA: serine protease [Methylomirabilota bacterium]|nr:serine protease [Methylomirabilota bacterium]